MNRTFATLILTAISATLGVTSLQAQDKAIANIPFTFHVKDQVMPAGRYVVAQPILGDKVLFSLSPATGGTRFVTAPLMASSDPENSKLTFACYAGECSLAKIELPGSGQSYSLRSSAHKVGMASMIAVRLTR
jgi:hypothetical protein